MVQTSTTFTLSWVVLFRCAASFSVELEAPESSPFAQVIPDRGQAQSEEVVLVQKKAALFQRLHSNSSERHVIKWAAKVPLQQLFPFYWVHIPKCGSTFFNLLANLPGACNLDTLNVTSETDIAKMCHRVDTNHLDLGKLIPKLCEGSFSHRLCTAEHSGIGSIYDSVVKGHGLIMFRQPEQRIASAYFNRFRSEPHSWPMWYYGRSPHNMKEYAQVVSGCAVKMLTRDGAGHAFELWDRDAPCGHPTLHATAEEAQIAIERLRQGFIFVGITEHWDMSVCLFHAMIGGECHASEFVNSNPGNHSTVEQHDTSELGGFTDVYDGLLYEEAQRIYSGNLEKYDVSASACEPCFRHRFKTDASKRW